MAEPFILINTYAIKPGHEDEYHKRFQEVADLVEANEPKMLYFAAHLSEDGSEAATVQVHTDADNMAFHLELVADHVRDAAQYLDFSTMSIRIYGSPTEAVLEQMRQLAGSGMAVTVSPAVVSFDRLATS